MAGIPFLWLTSRKVVIGCILLTLGGLTLGAFAQEMPSMGDQAQTPASEEALDSNGPSEPPPVQTSGPSETAAQSTPALGPSPVKSVQPDRVTELVGFVVRGRKYTERLMIEDLDSIVLPDGQRRLPLLRMLRTFGVAVLDQAGILSFSPEGVGPVQLDTIRQTIQIKDRIRPLDFTETTSEITLKADLYIRPADLAEILAINLEWDNALYEYRVQLDRTLSIWKRGPGRSLLDIQTELMTGQLPESLPAAERSQAALQLMEVRWRPQYQGIYGPSSSGSQDSHRLDFSSPQETLWGNLLQGRYRLELSHPELSWENTDRQWSWQNDDAYAARVGRFEWIWPRRDREIALGDSMLGIGELVFPAFDLTGVRMNGLVGFSKAELDSDRSSLGFYPTFSKPFVFEGTAPLGAKAELIINDQVTDVQEVIPEQGTPAGIGTYRFRDVELPTGILNNVVVQITETDGRQSRIERSVVGSPQLLPKGRLAYLAGTGSRRTMVSGIHTPVDIGEFSGHMAAGRVLYGLTDSMTVGVMAGFQEGSFPTDTLLFPWSDRSYPGSSRHVGVSLVCLPADRLLWSTEAAASSGSGNGQYAGYAARTRAEYLATERISLDTDLLYLGSNYFNGQNPDISDRVGGEMGMAWKIARQWSLDTGVGYLTDGLEHSRPDPLQVLYQSTTVGTTAIPKTTLEVGVRSLYADRDKDGLLAECRILAMPWPSVDLFGNICWGDRLQMDRSDFFWGLRLKRAPPTLGPSQYWSLRKSLNRSHSLGLGFSETATERTLSLLHYFNTDIAGRPLRFRTELFQDLSLGTAHDAVGVRMTGEYLLDTVGYNRLGASASVEDGAYRFTAYLAIRSLFAQHRGRLTNVNERRVRTAYGAVHGRVFMDYNNNLRLDPGEPGVQGVKVNLAGIRSVVTDKNGYYILSNPRGGSSARIYLDIDTVPALYTVTNGTQVAQIERDSLTEVNLSLVPSVSVVGRVVSSTDDGSSEPIPGVRIVLLNAQSGRFTADSLTARNGSFYLGNITPGEYTLKIDAVTLPSRYEAAEQTRPVSVAAGRGAAQDIRVPDWIVHTHPPADANQAQ